MISSNSLTGFLNLKPISLHSSTNQFILFSGSGILVATIGLFVALSSFEKDDGY